MPARPRVLVTRKLPPAVEERLARDYDADLNADDRPYAQDEIVARSAGGDALLVTITDRIDAALIARLPETLRILATFSVGTDHIDVAAARARGLPVTNTPGAVTEATAEIAALLLLGAARRAGEGEAMMRAGTWSGWAPTQLLGIQLAGKRLGIVGMGRIGQAVARRMKPFGMEIHYHNRRRLPPESEQGAIFHDSLRGLLAVSQFLSLHSPSTPETRHLLNAETIALLPRGAVVVNTARGDVVKDDDLIAALSSGQIAAAGLDVYQNEPRVHPGYKDLPNTFLLPHLGTATLETRTAMGMMAVDNVDAVLAGRPPLNPVG
ncbi:MAG: D-glycerate dehydrogenase [Rhodospirillales bacterium]|nr:D-glycerate dehydrogenase [Rhodospirillales bacterium]